MQTLTESSFSINYKIHFCQNFYENYSNVNFFYDI